MHNFVTYQNVYIQINIFNNYSARARWSDHGARSAQWTISSEFTPFQIRADIPLQLNDV